jgi:hypothetical protein
MDPQELEAINFRNGCGFLCLEQFQELEVGDLCSLETDTNIYRPLLNVLGNDEVDYRWV